MRIVLLCFDYDWNHHWAAIGLVVEVVGYLVADVGLYDGPVLGLPALFWFNHALDLGPDIIDELFVFTHIDETTTDDIR